MLLVTTMTDVLMWVGITVLFVLWCYWPAIKTGRANRKNREQSEVDRARELSKQIHPSNRD
jgi:hypothetical protein